MDALAPMDKLVEYWTLMAKEVENPPPKEQWATTLPILVWGDEGTLNGKSWMFVTWPLALILCQTSVDKLMLITISKLLY